MGVVAYCNEDEVLVVSVEDEESFLAQNLANTDRRKDYRRIEVPSGEVFHVKLFRPRLIFGAQVKV